MVLVLLTHTLISTLPPMSPLLLLHSSSLASPAIRRCRTGHRRTHLPGVLIKCMTKNATASFIETAAVVGGLVAAPLVGWSLYTLKTTGCGLPPGPGGSLGALEGVSYLLVLAIVSWSAYTKVKTGSGLPNGPFGLLGAVEGISYLAFLAILLVFGLQFLDKGFIPGPLPGEECFG